jgi:hypothetical protein
MLKAAKVKPHTVCGLEFPCPDMPPAGWAQEIAPGVCWLRMSLPFALEHINLRLLADGVYRYVRTHPQY